MPLVLSVFAGCRNRLRAEGFALHGQPLPSSTDSSRCNACGIPAVSFVSHVLSSPLSGNTGCKSMKVLVNDRHTELAVDCGKRPARAWGLARPHIRSKFEVPDNLDLCHWFPGKLKRWDDFVLTDREAVMVEASVMMWPFLARGKAKHLRGYVDSLSRRRSRLAVGNFRAYGVNSAAKQSWLGLKSREERSMRRWFTRLD